MSHTPSRSIAGPWQLQLEPTKHFMWLPALWWSRPSAEDEAAFLATCKGFNYKENFVGATSEAPFSSDRIEQLKSYGFFVNHSRVRLGSGLHTFTKGKDKLQNWGHLQLDSISVDPSTHVKVGGKFGMHVHEVVAWLINPLQIIYVTDSGEVGGDQVLPAKQGDGVSMKGPGPAVYAFGGGTLKGHLLAGEERFAVEWNKEDDSVWYDILSISKPAHFLSLAGLPIVRFQQQQFVKRSSDLMVREVRKDT